MGYYFVDTDLSIAIVSFLSSQENSFQDQSIQFQLFTHTQIVNLPRWNYLISRTELPSVGVISSLLGMNSQVFREWIILASLTMAFMLPPSLPRTMEMHFRKKKLHNSHTTRDKIINGKACNKGFTKEVYYYVSFLALKSYAVLFVSTCERMCTHKHNAFNFLVFVYLCEYVCVYVLYVLSFSNHIFAVIWIYVHDVIMCSVMHS